MTELETTSLDLSIAKEDYYHIKGLLDKYQGSIQSVTIYEND